MSSTHRVELYSFDRWGQLTKDSVEGLSLEDAQQHSKDNQKKHHHIKIFNGLGQVVHEYRNNGWGEQTYA